VQKISNFINSKHEAKIFKIRIIKTTIIISFLTAVLIFRLLYLQIYQNKFYSNLAQHNQIESIAVEPNRGLIYDRNGILIAENTPVFSLDIIPDHVSNLNKTLNELKTIIDLTDDNIAQFNKTLKQHRRYEHIPLKFKLSQEEVANFYVNQLRFPGVVIGARMIRHYPLDTYMASVLGYVGRINSQDLKSIDNKNYSASNFIGKIGIEKRYEKELHGTVGYNTVEVDATGHVVRTIKSTPPIPGRTLHLTIDSKLQKIAHDAFSKECGAAVAINPKNGEILALVSTPSFDPNLFTNGIDTDNYKKLRNSEDKPMYNRAIRGLFPLASTIKPFLALQGLDSGIINQNSTIFDPGYFTLPHSSHIYRDWVHNGHSNVNVSKALVVSCDVFFYNLATKMGIEKIDVILEKFGFGNKTGIDIQEEISGIVASPKWKRKRIGKSWYPGDTVISGIGQGYMSTTPLQLANATAIIAMHGIRFQPHLLLASKLPDGKIINTQLPLLQPIKLRNTKTWTIVINAMEDVISNQQGTARTRFGTDISYTVAGKTGGAQLYHHKIVNENPTPESEDNIPKRLRNHTLFIAFAPVENPKIALAVILEHNSSAPVIARKIIDQYLLGHTQNAIPAEHFDVDISEDNDPNDASDDASDISDTSDTSENSEI
jgi:penicillin-binding protein 2